MLVLSRKPGEKITVGDGITLTIVACGAGRVRVGIDAPARVAITRPAAPAVTRSPQKKG